MNETVTKARILVVDDSKLMRKAASKMLGDEFEIATAEDGVEAWDMLEADTSLQVVFTDLMMPRSDGYELLQKIRTAAEPGLQNLPVIMVTGADNDEAARKKALDLGATDFITKPFNSTDLLARARVHAKYQRIARQLEAQTTLDALTGLVNKGGFLDRLQQELAFARRHQQPLTLARLEILGFRQLFLKHGKEVADALVLHVANSVRERIRPEDTAGRIGLGEVAISFLAGQPAGIDGLMRRICEETRAALAPIAGVRIPLQLGYAVASTELRPGLEAQSLIDQCQPVVAPKPAVAAAAPAAKPAAPSATGAAAGGEALRLDPLLDGLERGDGFVAEHLPAILRRLQPLLRVLTLEQRSQLALLGEAQA